MIDLHMHSIFSDGELIPSEVVSRCRAAGYEALAITDHGDPSNLELLVERMVHVCGQLNGRVEGITVHPGVEITHVPPELIGPLAARARELGAAVVVVHGETITEPVPKGTNRAALLADVDILAHPGLITEEEVEIARAKGVHLEITARKGHSLTNGHVAALAKRIGAPLVYNTDAHSPGDFTPWGTALKIIRGAGLDEGDALRMQENSRTILARRARRG